MSKVCRTTAVMVGNPHPSPPALPNYLPANRDEFVANYWGGASKVKNYFAIDMDKLDDLFALSPSDEVALHVANVENINKVVGEWIVYDKKNDAVHKKSTKKDYYFVFQRDFYDRKFQFLPDSKKGGMKGRQPNNVVCALLGKDKKDNYFAFINTANLVVDDGGIGGNGFTGGVKIPTGS